MIDLAPNSKRGLELSGPLILAGGYGAEVGRTLLARFRALVTPPTSLRPRSPSRGETRMMPVPGGFLYDRKGANPGLAVVLQANRHIWRHLEVTIIFSLAAEDRAHWGDIGRRVSRVEAVAAIELEIDEESDALDEIRAVRAETDLPIVAKIPIEGALETGEAALKEGADVLSVGLGPRGSVFVDGRQWEGRLAGPLVKPLTLRAVQVIAQSHPEWPVIAAGGLETTADVRDLLAAGARAVQIDTALWRDPGALLEITS